jgi:site-specific recombinase XerD
MGFPGWRDVGRRARFKIFWGGKSQVVRSRFHSAGPRDVRDVGWSTASARSFSISDSVRFLTFPAAGKSRNPIRDRLLVLLAYRHALRVSELVDLRVDQFDLKAAQVHVRRAKNGIPSIHGLQGDELRLIRQLIRENGEHSRFLFLSERRAPLSIDGVQKLIERLGEATGFKFPIHVHMLRHSAGYALAGRGVDTRTLQVFMGHRSISNTTVYTAVADKRIRNIWQAR